MHLHPTHLRQCVLFLVWFPYWPFLSTKPYTDILLAQQKICWDVALPQQWQLLGWDPRISWGNLHNLEDCIRPWKVTKPNRKPDRLPGPPFFSGKLAAKLQGYYISYGMMVFLGMQPSVSFTGNTIDTQSSMKELILPRDSRANLVMESNA